MERHHCYRDARLQLANLTTHSLQRFGSALLGLPMSCTGLGSVRPEKVDRASRLSVGTLYLHSPWTHLGSLTFLPAIP